MADEKGVMDFDDTHYDILSNSQRGNV